MASLVDSEAQYSRRGWKTSKYQPVSRVSGKLHVFAHLQRWRSRMDNGDSLLTMLGTKHGSTKI